MSHEKDLNALWQMIYEKLRGKFSETTFELWFGSLVPVKLSESAIFFVLEIDLKRRIVSDKFKSVIEATAEEVLGFSVQAYILPPDMEELAEPESAIDEKKQDSDIKEPFIIGDATRYSFSNFIIGSSNKFAHAACVAVSSSPSVTYNPLFVYGPSGVGKTHLMYAISNKIKTDRPEVNLVYIKGEEFANQLIESIAKKTTASFREKFRRADVLLIDDIQFISGKISTQEEVFHTFNFLYEENKQIILTSDRPPKEISNLEDRLRTRFECGLLADIQSPDIELRMAIIKEKSSAFGIQLPNDVVTYIADRLKDNIRQLEGAIKKIRAVAFLYGMQITVEVARSAISDLMTDTEPVNLTIDKIFLAVTNKYGISKYDLKGKKRTEDITFARHVCIYLLRSLTDLSLKSIGKMFSRDHSTVMNSLQKIETQINTDPDFYAELGELISEVKQ